MVHPWAGTNVCNNPKGTGCGHKFKDKEDKIISEDWSSTETDKHFQAHPKRWAQCVGCARAHGSGSGNDASVQSYKVQHKGGYSGGT
mgnify:CR=1 FL=1